MGTTSWLAGFLVLASLGATGGRAPRRSPCAVIDSLHGQIQPGDSVYDEAAGLVRELAAHGVTVRCFYHTTMEGWLNERRAAGFGTDSSFFMAYFFDTPDGGERVQVRERSKRVRMPCPPYRDTTWYSYSIRRHRGNDVEWSGYSRSYFVAKGGTFILVYDQPTAFAIRQALNAAP